MTAQTPNSQVNRRGLTCQALLYAPPASAPNDEGAAMMAGRERLAVRIDTARRRRTPQT